MNEEQRRAAIEVIQADCLARRVYVANNGYTCAVAALGIAAGLEPAAFAGFNTESITEPELEFVREAIELKFGIDEDTLDKIQSLNDLCDSVEARRQSIIRYLNSL
jgi:hypothetical protein